MFAMHHILWLCLLSIWAMPIMSWAGQVAPTPQPATITQAAAASILAPLPGQALQGIVQIIGNTSLEGLISAELSFAYTNDLKQTWFLISLSDQPVKNGILAQWDTTTLTDGIYDLRLVVTLKDGDQKVSILRGVRVRNYTPIETNTPAPPTSTATPLPGHTPTPSQTPLPLPTSTQLPNTPLPTNPAQLTRLDVTTNLGIGALAVTGFFAVMGLYGLLRSSFRRR
jgi:hypothetical protein